MLLVFFIWFPFTVPQILALLADQNLPADVEANMNTVTYSSRFAMALFFDQSTDFNLGSGVCAKYFDGDDVMRYMSVDSLKRNCSESNNKRRPILDFSTYIQQCFCR